MTKVINLIGGPSIGKSTMAAYIYFSMKEMGYKVELVREVAKEWAWEGREIGPFDQMAILGEQIRRESTLFGKVDYIITDSPAILGAFYFDYNHDETFMNRMVKNYYNYSESHGVEFYNFVLPRMKQYDPSGRFETEEEAKKIDYEIKHFLDEYQFEWIQLSEYEDIEDTILFEVT